MQITFRGRLLPRGLEQRSPSYPPAPSLTHHRGAPYLPHPLHSPAPVPPLLAVHIASNRGRPQPTLPPLLAVYHPCWRSNIHDATRGACRCIRRKRLLALPAVGRLDSCEGDSALCCGVLQISLETYGRLQRLMQMTWLRPT
jgi:hypothetical protein